MPSLALLVLHRRCGLHTCSDTTCLLHHSVGLHNVYGTALFVCYIGEMGCTRILGYIIILAPSLPNSTPSQSHQSPLSIPWPPAQHC